MAVSPVYLSSQLKYIYFIVNPRSEGDSYSRMLSDWCGLCVLRVCKFWVGHEDLSLPQLNLHLRMNFWMAHRFDDITSATLRVCFPSERPLEWDGYFWVCAADLLREKTPHYRGLRDVTAIVYPADQAIPLFLNFMALDHIIKFFINFFVFFFSAWGECIRELKGRGFHSLCSLSCSRPAKVSEKYQRVKKMKGVLKYFLRNLFPADH